MGLDTMKPELSRKSDYWIPKERYYELLHYVRQYPSWKKTVAMMNGYGIKSSSIIVTNDNKLHRIQNDVEDIVVSKSDYEEKIKTVDYVAELTNPVIGKYLVEGVVDKANYEQINARHDLPCSRSEYYNLYRRFFWLLNYLKEPG